MRFLKTKFVLLIGLLIVFAGCGDGRYTVTGKAVYDGQPVDSGTIVFAAAEGGTNYDGLIEQGNYSLRVPTGDYLVRINGLRIEHLEKPLEIAPGVFEGTSTISKSYIPAVYNTKTTLRIKVSPKERVHDFMLDPVKAGTMNSKRS